jgi:hypothetical protein
MKIVRRGLLAAALLCAACSDKEPGAALARGQGRGLQVAPGGGAVAFLLDARHPDDRGVPEDLLLGDLYAAPAAGEGAARKLGAGVSSAAGAYRFSATGGSIAYLAAFRFRAGAGELHVAANGGGAARKLADEVSAFAWAPQGEKLAWIAGGKLSTIEGPGGAPRALGDGVSSFAWSPDGTRLAARGPTIAGAELWLFDVASGERREVGRDVTDYAFAADGALGLLGKPGPRGGDRALSIVEPGAAPREVGRATSFVFAPQGHELLALSTDKQPGEATGDLVRIARGQPAPQLLGPKSTDFRYAPSGDALFLARYDIRARAGALTLAPAGGGPVRELATKVQAFTLAPGGRRVLYLVQKPSKGDFKLELWTAELHKDAPAPRLIDEGVYGYEPSADGKTLFWKARCGYGPRSCSLFRAPLEGGAATPVELAKNVAGFDLSADGARLLIGAPHRGSARAVDLSWLPSTAGPNDKPIAIAVDVDPSARFVDAAGRRAAFAVLQPGRPAVYLADLR